MRVPATARCAGTHRWETSRRNACTPRWDTRRATHRCTDRNPSSTERPPRERPRREPREESRLCGRDGGVQTHDDDEQREQDEPVQSALDGNAGKQTRDRNAKHARKGEATHHIAGPRHQNVVEDDPDEEGDETGTQHAYGACAVHGRKRTEHPPPPHEAHRAREKHQKDARDEERRRQALQSKTQQSRIERTQGKPDQHQSGARAEQTQPRTSKPHTARSEIGSPKHASPASEHEHPQALGRLTQQPNHC